MICKITKSLHKTAIRPRVFPRNFLETFHSAFFVFRRRNAILSVHVFALRYIEKITFLIQLCFSAEGANEREIIMRNSILIYNWCSVMYPIRRFTVAVYASSCTPILIYRQSTNLWVNRKAIDDNNGRESKSTWDWSKNLLGIFSRSGI